MDYQDYHYYHVGVLSIRIKTVSIDIKERIVTMGCLFVLEGIVKPYIMAIDSTHSYQGSWESMAQIIHMDKGIVPRSGIDKDARWWWW